MPFNELVWMEIRLHRTQQAKFIDLMWSTTVCFAVNNEPTHSFLKASIDLNPVQFPCFGLFLKKELHQILLYDLSCCSMLWEMRVRNQRERERKKKKKNVMQNYNSCNMLPQALELTNRLFQYLFHPCVTAVACKISRSFCQKCRWQVTTKHAYTLRMWLCMKWHVVWCTQNLHRDGSIFMWHQPCQCLSTPLWWIFKNVL